MTIACPRCNGPARSGATRRRGHCRPCWTAIGGRDARAAAQRRIAEGRRQARNSYQNRMRAAYERKQGDTR